VLVSGLAVTVCDWALAVGGDWWWDVCGMGWEWWEVRGECPNNDWLRDSREPSDRSASLDTK